MSSSISVIIAARNERANFKDTLATIGTEPDEIIVLDDASDPGQEITHFEFRDVLVITNKVQLGVGQTRELGSRTAKGDILLFTDGHMRFPAHWIDRIREGFDAMGPRALLCSTYLHNKQFPSDWFKGDRIGGATMNHYEKRRAGYGTDSEFRLSNMHPLPAKLPGSGPVPVPCVIGACYAIHADFYHEIGGFQGLYGYGGDEQLLSWKAWLAGGTVAYLPNLPVVHVDQSHRKIRVDQVRMFINLLYVTRISMGDDWFMEMLNILPWWAMGVLPDVMGRYTPTFKRVLDSDDISLRFGLQTVGEAITLAGEDYKKL